MPLAPGTRIAGYVVDRVLGQGGMGTVYEATQLSLGRVVALKIIAPQLASDAEFRERFQREGRIQAALDHRSIVTVHEAGESDHGFFIAMRLVRGPTLKDLVSEGMLDPPRAFKLLAAVADALDTANEAGLVHRDVKPQNILVDQRDHAFLADFGVTKSRGQGGLTRTGQWVGTLEYVSPEQVLGQPISGASDRYSFGVVLHECLTGMVPFSGDTDAALLYAHAHAPPPPVTSVRPDLPDELDAVLARALAKDPSERHPTAMDMVADAQRAYEEGMARTASGAAAPLADPFATPEPVAYDRRASDPRPTHLSERTSDRENLPGTRQGSPPVEFEKPRAQDPSTIELAKPAVREETTQRARPPLPPTRPQPPAQEERRTPAPPPPPDRSQLPLTRIEDPVSPPGPPRAPAGPLPERAPAPPPPERRRTTSPAILLLAVPILIALGVAGFLLGKGGGEDGGGDPPVVASERVASGPFQLRVPAGWREPSQPTDIPGLELQDRVERAPAAGGGSLIVGIASAQDSSLLPAPLRERLGDVSPDGAVRLGNIDALRYSDLRVIQPGDPAAVYAAPVTDGALTAACVGSEPAFKRMCAAAVATLRLTSGENFGLGADTRLEDSLTDAFGTLDSARSRGISTIRSARRAAGQAGAANAVADAYATAAQQVQSGSDNPVSATTRARVSGQLREAAQAWRAAARAARSRSRAGYRRAGAAVRTAESKLRTGLAQLGE